MMQSARKNVVFCLAVLLALLGCACSNAATADWVLDLPQPNPALSAQPETVSYPIASQDTISILLPSAPEGCTLLGRAAELTGIEAEYQFVPMQDYAGALSQMMQTGDVPDLFYGKSMIGVYDYLDYGDEVALDMTEVISRCAPNYLAAIREDPVLSSTAFDGEYGEMFAFYQIRQGSGMSGYGPVIRQDWLDALGLDVPQTYDEYHDVLAAFRDRYGCEQPLGMGYIGAMAGDYLAAGYGVTAFTNGSDMASVGFYCEDGQIKYGPAEEGFWDYLTMLHQWYEEKLFTSDFVTWADSSEYGKLILNNQMGIAYGTAADAAGWARNITGGGRLSSIPDAVRQAGQETHLGNQSNRRTGSPTFSISAKSDKADLCARWCDFWYSEAGTQLVNYGTEEQIEPEQIEQTSRYTLLPGIYDMALAYQTADEAARTAADAWGANRDNAWRLPEDMQLSEADQQRFAILAQGLTTAVTVWSCKVIVGEQSLDSRADFLTELEQDGLQKCIDCLTAYLQ